MSDQSTSICRYLEWDSSHFGFRIAQSLPSTLRHDSIGSLLKWCSSEHIDCLYFLSESDDDLTINLVEEHGFHLVDIRLTFQKRIAVERQKPKLTSEFLQIRRFVNKDISILKKIARVNYRFTRFYYDSHFSRDLCDSMYEIWIEKSCNGMADEVFVAEVKDVVCGYVTCTLDKDLVGKIGLIGVHPDWHGKGIGQYLVENAISWFLEKGAHNIEVVTKGRNIPAQRLYQKSGLLSASIQFWYHKWFNQKVNP